MKKIKFLFPCIFLLPSAVHGFSSIAEIPYLVKLVEENIKRHRQLETAISQARQSNAHMRAIHDGTDNAVGLVPVLPLGDHMILENLKNFRETMEAVERLYGSVPEGEGEAMFELHDNTVAESLSLINESKGYAKVQEKNAQAVFRQAPSAAPKGAARMAAVANSQILHSLSQLIRINAQMLKLQSEAFANENRSGKDSANHFNTMNDTLGDGIGDYRGPGGLPRF